MYFPKMIVTAFIFLISGTQSNYLTTIAEAKKMPHLSINIDNKKSQVANGNKLKIKKRYCKSVAHYGDAVTGWVSVFEKSARFYPSKSLKKGISCEDQNMYEGNNWFILKYDTPVGFHDNGRLSYGTLAEDDRFGDGSIRKAGTVVKFDRDGNLLN